MTDYARLDWQWLRHARRFARYVAAHGLPCQECGGMGGEREAILDDGSGPWHDCGWCEGTGKTTRWLRGLWLRDKRRAA